MRLLGFEGRRRALAVRPPTDRPILEPVLRYDASRPLPCYFDRPWRVNFVVLPGIYHWSDRFIRAADWYVDDDPWRGAL